MLVNKQWIEESNGSHLAAHQRSFDYTASGINNVASILQKLVVFQVAIASCELGTGVT